MVVASQTRRIRFGPFEVDLASSELFKHSIRIKLQDQPFQILTILLERPREVVSREALRRKLWAEDTFVDFDAGMNAAIRRLRDALNDSADQPRYIETLPRRGYRFIAETETIPSEANPPASIALLPTRTPDTAFLPGAASLPSRGAITPPEETRLLLWLSSAAVTGGLILLLVLGTVSWRHRIFQAHASPRIQAIAVLPLQNLSGDPAQEYFADEMTDALITNLSHISSLQVISRTSVMRYKNSHEPLSKISKDLNVDAVLEGSVVRSGDRVRVTVHLDRASADGQLWASAYDRNVRDILDLQNEIAHTVTDEIQVKLTPQEHARLAGVRPIAPEAHDEYLRGRSVLAGGTGHLSKLASKKQYSEQEIQTAIAYFKSAIDKDPAYAQAYAGLADAYIHLGNPGWGAGSPKKSLSDAKEAATTALKLDPSLPEAHFSLAQTLQYDWNWPEAEKEYNLALKLNPNYVNAHLEYGRFVQALGRNDEALAQMHYADELDPFNIAVKETEAWVTYASGQYDLALKQFEDLGDDGGLTHIYREKGMYPEALALNKRCIATHPSISQDPYALAVQASIYGLQGRNDEAEALIKEVEEIARHRYVSGFFFAEAYVGLGQRDQAITWLERAYDAHDQWMVFANSYPGLDPLRSEPRFQALLRRMQFPPAH
jgi:TolB-like protein/DNA-binding winged helix-turn-helix (wHTH) protein